jgi:TP901 family phage tail tape measure protein
MTELFKLAGIIAVDGLQQAKKDIEDFEKSVKKTLAPLVKFGKQAEYAGRQLSKNITLPIAGIGAAATKFAGDFDKSMTTSMAIMGDVSNTMQKTLAATAKQISTETTFSADELAKAYYYLASAGMNAEQSVAALGKVANFAAAGQFDLQVATDLLTDAQSALGLASKDAAQNEENLVRISNVLVKAATTSNATVQQFAESLTNKAGVAFRNLGKDVEEAVAILAAFADQGVKGDEAGTQLMIVMRDLQKAALNNKKEFKRFGIAVYDQNEQMRNTADIISDLEKVLSSLTDEQKRATLSTLGFQDKSLNSIMTLIGVSDAIRDNEAAYRSVGNITEEVAKKQLNNFNDQMKILLNRLKVAAINFGEVLLPIIKDSVVPVIEDMLEKIEMAAKMFSDLPKSTQRAVIGFAAFVAAIGPVLLLVGQLISVLKVIPAALLAIKIAFIALNGVMLTNPFVVVAAAVIALGVAVYNLTDKYHKLKRAHESTIRVMTVDQAKNEKLKAAYESLIKDIQEASKVMNDESAILNSVGTQIDDVTKLMREFGYHIEGTRKQRLKAIESIYMEINGALVLRDTHEKEIKTKETIAKKTEDLAILTEEYTDAELDLMQQIDDSNRKLIERQKAIEANKNNLNELLKFEKESAEYREYIDKKYTELNMNEGDQRLVNLTEQKNEELKLAQQYGADTAKVAKYWDDQIAEYKREQLAGEIKLYGGFAQQATGILSGFYDNQAIKIDNNYKREKKTIENSELKEEEKKNALEKLDEEYDKKKSSLQKKQMFAEKAQALFSVAVNTAVAAVDALPNLILSGIVTAFGLAQAAIIASKPIPELAEGGVIKRSVGGSLVRAAEAGDDEGFIPMKKGTASIAQAIINSMKRYPGGQTETARPSGDSFNNSVNLNIGTLIADDNGIMELERRLKVVRISENNRLGLT